MDDTTLNDNARHLVFLTAAWIANIDGHENPLEVDALCQPRNALGISPSVARNLHQLARGACGPAPRLVQQLPAA